MQTTAERRAAKSNHLKNGPTGDIAHRDIFSVGFFYFDLCQWRDRL